MKTEKTINASVYAIPGIPRYRLEKEIICERQFKDHLEDVIKLVCSVFEADLKPVRRLIYKAGSKQGGKRTGSTEEISAAMHACVYIAFTTASIGFRKAGNVMGCRNHSTVIYAVKKVESLCEVYPDFRHKINTILFRMGQPQLPKQGKWKLK